MGAIVAIIGVCIPIVAIISAFQFKIQKLKIEQGQGYEHAKKMQQLEEKIQKMDSENKALKKRLNNVETIVSDPDFLLSLPEKDESESVQQLLEALAEKKRLRNQ